MYMSNLVLGLVYAKARNVRRKDVFLGRNPSRHDAVSRDGSGVGFGALSGAGKTIRRRRTGHQLRRRLLEGTRYDGYDHRAELRARAGHEYIWRRSGAGACDGDLPIYGPRNRNDAVVWKPSCEQPNLNFS